MSEEDMAPGKSSIAVNNCIRQLSYHKHNLHDTAGIWGEVREFTDSFTLLFFPLNLSQQNISNASIHCMCCVLSKGKDMLMILENDTMNLIDPLRQNLLHAQPIGSIRVWGVGRDNGRSVSQSKCRWIADLIYYHFGGTSKNMTLLSFSRITTNTSQTDLFSFFWH